MCHSEIYVKINLEIYKNSYARIFLLSALLRFYKIYKNIERTVPETLIADKISVIWLITITVNIVTINITLKLICIKYMNMAQLALM